MIDPLLIDMSTRDRRAAAAAAASAPAVARDRRRRRARRPRRRLLLRRVRRGEAAPRRPRRATLRRALVRRGARRSGVVHRPRPVGTAEDEVTGGARAHPRRRARRRLAARRRPRTVRRPASTLALDLLFGMLQMPHGSARRARVAARRRAVAPTPLEGALAGGAAARCRRAHDAARCGAHASRAREQAAVELLRTAQKIVERYGVQGLFRGILPRTAHMALGGVVYLGSYRNTTDLVTRRRVIRFQSAFHSPVPSTTSTLPPRRARPPTARPRASTRRAPPRARRAARFGAHPVAVEARRPQPLEGDLTARLSNAAGGATEGGAKVAPALVRTDDCSTCSAVGAAPVSRFMSSLSEALSIAPVRSAATSAKRVRRSKKSLQGQIGATSTAVPTGR